MVAARTVVWDYNIATRAMLFSSNAEQVLGTSDRDIDSVTACVPADDVARVMEARNRAIAERSGYQLIMRFVRPVDGRTIWIDVRGKVRCDADGEPVSVRGVTLDVTERITAEDDLRQAHRRKDEFLAMLAHELRNPLAPISSAAQLLTHLQPDDARATRASDIIVRQVEHITGLVDDLIDVSRVTRGLISTDQQPCDIARIVEQAVEQARPAIEARATGWRWRRRPSSSATRNGWCRRSATCSPTRRNTRPTVAASRWRSTSTARWCAGKCATTASASTPR
jgi:PAS domain S-box-containing protein